MSSISPRPLLLPALALFLALLGAGRAEAQIFPAAPPPEGEAGELVTRVRLGYYVPDLRGFVKLDTFDDRTAGSELSFTRTFDLDPILVLPTFEVSFFWENAGGIYVQYMEAGWQGEMQTFSPLRFEEQVIEPGQILDTRYLYRSIAIGEELQVPLADFLTLRLLATQRYVRHEIKVQGFRGAGFSARNSLETIVPTVGVGFDAFIWNVISGYGSIQWLDFRTGMFGDKDDRWETSYKEFHLGVRLELVEHAHVLVEYFHFETKVTDGRRETYRQQLAGPRIMVAILF